MNSSCLSLDDLTREYLEEIDTRLESYAECAEQVIKIPESLGSGQNYLIKVSGDIDLMVSESCFNQAVSFDAPNPEMCGAMIVLEGECRMQTQHNGAQYTVKTGQACLFVLGSSKCSVSYPKGAIKMINFSVPKQLMAELGQQSPDFSIVKENDSYNIISDCLLTVPVSPELGKNIQQIYAANLSKEARHLFINAKVIEILALIFHSYKEQHNRYPGVKAADLSSIMSAAEIIEREMAAPPTLPELARRVGINDNKLKRLFKVVFDQTVFGYLKEKRMQAAAELLIHGELSIQQVSETVGFKHSGHFSKLFGETYGVAPLEYKRRYNPHS